MKTSTLLAVALFCLAGQAAAMGVKGDAAAGKQKATACAACHGNDGKGNKALGAPNLTDKDWLHGWGEAAIVNIINNGKLNQMPAQAAKLTEGQIHVLASYVWGLSNKPVAAIAAPTAAPTQN